MKTKFIKRASALIMAAITIMLCSLTVLAEESYKKAGAYTEKDFYIYDETHNLLDNSRDKLLEKMKELYGLSGCSVGFFYGKNKRSFSEASELADAGAEDMFLSYGSEGAFFVYLDYDGDTQYNDCISCVGAAERYLPNGENDTYDAVGNVLKNTRSTYQDSPNAELTHNMMLRASYVCDCIMSFIRDPFLLEAMEAETTSYPDDVSQYSNPDDYIISEFSKQASYSTNSSTTSNDKEYKSDFVYFYDEGGKFSTTQADKVVQTFEKTSREIGFDLILISASKSRSDSSVESVAKSKAKTDFPNSDNPGAVCLYIDLDGYKNAYDYMFARNDAFLYYTNGDDGTEDRNKKILRAMQAYFPAGGQQIVMTDIISGLEEYCRQLISYKAKGPESGIYYTHDVTGEYVYAQNGQIIRSSSKPVMIRPYKYWWAGLLVGFAFAAIAVLIARSAVRKHYKFKSSTSASVYTSQEKIFIRNAQDIFIGTHVTKVRIQSSSGHGGHGGGGGHVGGGGGGSHR